MLRGNPLDLAKRFEVRKMLGAGGMGVVYEAFDTERNELVALKIMKSIDAAAIYRFKNEFRKLADVRHRNLVHLYELLAADDDWGFTMELIRGSNFRKFVRNHDESDDDNRETSLDAPPLPATFDTVAIAAGIRARPHRASFEPVPFDEARLRSSLAQLATGVFALHHAGFLHRDIKPSNVLVSSEGRVVLCDFGLAKNLETDSAQTTGTAQGVVRGTVAYMSPEQAAGMELTKASDWYSVGVMLYEILTGYVPYHGPPLVVLQQKQTSDPNPPTVANPKAPPDLAELCSAMLGRDPAARPSGSHVLSVLGAAPAEVSEIDTPSTVTLRTPFVGREDELDAVWDAYRAARDGRTVTLFVSGESGAGKSAVLQHFADQLGQTENAAVLTGRCHERESVPYKAIDSIIDALSSYLMKLPRTAAASIVPAGADSLGRLFPVLLRVPRFEEMRGFGVPDPQELRRRAFTALREILRRIGQRQPLVLIIDDLQWGDTDSGRLLREVLHPPGAPSVLLIASFRSEYRSSSALLANLLPGEGRTSPLGEIRELAIGPLDDTCAANLAAELLDLGSDSELVATVVREAEGSPFFVTELARYILTGASLGEVSLQDVVLRRVAQLPEHARTLLSTVAVAGRPVPLAVALQASELGCRGREALGVLRSTYLVRGTGIARRDNVECYHDRVREAVAASLEKPELRDRHEAMARAFEAQGNADPEVLMEHWYGAGDHRRAAGYAQRAATLAAEGLAFDRAARLYQRALDLGRDSRETRIQLANALANAAHGPEAARMYESAIAGATAAQALELRRLAAQQWLYTGHMEQGLDATREVLDAIGMRLASTPRRALFSLVRRRVIARLRGLRYTRRDVSQVSAEELQRIDILWSVATGLSIVDTIRGADLQTHHLLRSLAAGEPYRVARGLALEAAFAGTGGARTRKRADRLAALALELATDIDNPHAIGFSHLVRGAVSFTRGEWQTALDCFRRADTRLREQCTGVTWELSTCTAFQLVVAAHLGRIDELIHDMPERMRDIVERGDLYAANLIAMALADLGADAPKRARRTVDDVHSRWVQSGFHIQHFEALVAHSTIDLYSGRALEAWKHLDAKWPALKASQLLRVQYVYIQMHYIRGLTALALARITGDRSLVRGAAKDARRLLREPGPWGAPLGRVLASAIARSRGKDGPALELLTAAERQLGSADMALYAASCRLRRGELTGGADGKCLIEQGRTMVAELGAQNPDAMADALTPRFHAPGRAAN